MRAQRRKWLFDLVFAVSAIGLFALSHFYAERYAAQSGLAFRGLPTSPSPQHYHDLQRYTAWMIALLAILCIVSRRWFAAAFCVALFFWSRSTDVYY
jgi:hypothetical protein